MKNVLTKVSLAILAIIVTTCMCSFSPAYAEDGQQAGQAVNGQYIAMDEVQPMGIGIYPVYYRVINVRLLTPQWSKVGVAEGIPAMTLGISRTQAISVTYSATFGASYSQINAAVGWTYGTSTSVSIDGSYTVPQSYAGQKVKSATLTAYAKINVKSYQVEKHNETGGIELSTGIAKKAENYVRFEVKLYFMDGSSITIAV